MTRRWLLSLLPFLSLARGVILCYHGVDRSGSPLSLDPELFAEQMEALARGGFQTVSLAQWYSAMEGKQALPSRSVVLTFDDALAGVYEFAFPFLQSLGFQATVFVPTGFVGGRSDWVLEMRNPEQDAHIHPLPLMGWEELAELARAGWEIESHTVSHPDLTTLTDGEVRKELLQSREMLRAKLGIESRFLCYPYGRFNGRTVALARICGFVGGVTLEVGPNSATLSPFRLRRGCIDQGCSFPHLHFLAHLSFLSPLLPLRREVQRLLGK